MRATSDLPDKERILVQLVRSLLTTLTLKMPFQTDYETGYGGEYVHFVPGDDAKPGDLVVCNTSGIHDFTVAWVVEADERRGEFLLREIGSERTCRMGNESVNIVRGLKEPWIWEGDKYDFYRKVWKAFWKTNDDWYRYGGLEFTDDGLAIITIREKFGGMVANDLESVPFTVTMRWSKKTSIKAIVTALVDGGVGTRKFERRPKPKEPNTRC